MERQYLFFYLKIIRIRTITKYASKNFMLHLFNKWHDKRTEHKAILSKKTMEEQKLMIKELSCVDETKNILKIFFAFFFRMIEMLILIFFSSYYFGMLWIILSSEF